MSICCYIASNQVLICQIYKWQYACLIMSPCTLPETFSHWILQLGAVQNRTGNDLSTGTTAYNYARKAHICVPPVSLF